MMRVRCLWYGFIFAGMPYMMAGEVDGVQLSQAELETMLKPMKAFEQMPPLGTLKPLLSVDKVPYVSAEAYFEYFFTQQAKKWLMPFRVSEEPLDIGLEWTALFCEAESFVVLSSVKGDVVQAKKCTVEERQRIVKLFIEESIRSTRTYVEQMFVQEQVDSIVRQFGGIPEGVNMTEMYTNTSDITIPLFIMDALCQQDLLRRIDVLVNEYRPRSEESNEVIIVIDQALRRFMEIVQQEQTQQPAQQK